MHREAVHQQCILSLDKRYTLRPESTHFPFISELSLVPLVEFWQQTVTDDHPLQGALATRVQQALQQAPALLEPIADLAVITTHRELVDILMAMAFPQALWDGTYTAALLPFQMRSFYATPSFERLLMTDDGYLRGRVNVDEHTVAHVKLLHAYTFILAKVYGIAIDFDYPLIFTATDPDTGLDRHFRMNFDGRFMDVKTVGPVTPLTDETRRHLLAHLADAQVLMELLPPAQFILHGFAVLNAVDVTDQEVLSSLKRDLIEKESIISTPRFKSLQEKLRALFRKPALYFGLAACQGDRVLVLNDASRMEHG